MPPYPDAEYKVSISGGRRKGWDIQMEANTKYRILEHIKYEISGGNEERVLIIPNSGNAPDMKKVLCLSNTSLLIWKMIMDQKNYGQIIEEMSQRYNVESKKMESDLKEFLCVLMEKGFIRIMD